MHKNNVKNKKWKKQNVNLFRKKRSRIYIKKLKIISNWIEYQSESLKNVVNS